MKHIILAVSRILGTILSGDGPELSARRRLIDDAFMDGMTASMNTKTPIPPIQWEKLLQNRIPFGKISMFVNIDAPVVVKPDTDSKIQSIKLLK